MTILLWLGLAAAAAVLFMMLRRPRPAARRLQHRPTNAEGGHATQGHGGRDKPDDAADSGGDGGDGGGGD